MIQTNFDRFAILLSGICAIHCIVLPVVASLAPLLAATIHHGNILHEFWFHQFIIVFILPVSIFALVTGFRNHGQITPIVLGSIGLTILVFTALFAEYLISRQFLPLKGETVLTILGGIIHAAGHIANIFATKAFRTSCVTE